MIEGPDQAAIAAMASELAALIDEESRDDGPVTSAHVHSPYVAERRNSKEMIDGPI
jgi:hypothetical protein